MRYFVALLTLIIVIGFGALGFGYIRAINEKNEIERARIESEERLEMMQLEQQIQEREQEILLQAAERDAELEARYRDECREVQNENMEEYERFVNICTQSNSIDYCIDTDIANGFEADFGPDFIQRCVESKLRTGW